MNIETLHQASVILEVNLKKFKSRLEEMKKKNTIERTRKREQLQEDEDWLLDAIELLLSQKID